MLVPTRTARQTRRASDPPPLGEAVLARRRRPPLPLRAAPPNRGGGPSGPRSASERNAATMETLGLLTAALALSTLVAGSLAVAESDAFGDFIYDHPGLLSFGPGSGFGPGDALAAVLWTGAFWLASPWQLLLIFLGRIDTERPSDWLMVRLGSAMGDDSDATSAKPSGAVRAAAWAATAAAGVSTAGLLEVALGDATWGVAGGLGSLLAGAMFEARRAGARGVDGGLPDTSRAAPSCA